MVQLRKSGAVYPKCESMGPICVEARVYFQNPIEDNLENPKTPFHFEKYAHARQPEKSCYFSFTNSQPSQWLGFKSWYRNRHFLEKNFRLQKSWASHAGEKPDDGLSGERLRKKNASSNEAEKTKGTGKTSQTHWHQNAQIFCVGKAN